MFTVSVARASARALCQCTERASLAVGLLTRYLMVGKGRLRPLSGFMELAKAIENEEF